MEPHAAEHAEDAERRIANRRRTTPLRGSLFWRPCAAIGPQFAQGGGTKAIARQHEKNRLTARERIAPADRSREPFFELGLLAAWGCTATGAALRRPASSPASAPSRAGGS